MKQSHTPASHPGRRMHRMKKRVILALLLLATAAPSLFAQGVGINTKTPDPSAALDIAATDKGVLIPKVNLTSVLDNTTVPNAANTLLIYNTNAALPYGEGFYYNSGLSISPIWKSIAELHFPYSKSAFENGTLFELKNVALDQNSTTLHTVNVNGYALSTEGKIKIAGPGQTPGKGKVLTSDANGNATWQGGVAFSASGCLGGGSEKIAGQSTIKVPFALVDYDFADNYQDANGSPASTFLVKVNGIYHINVQLSVNTPGVIELVQSFTGEVLATAIGYSISKDLFLHQGDRLIVRFTSGADSGEYSYIDTKSHKTFFNGRLVLPQ